MQQNSYRHSILFALVLGALSACGGGDEVAPQPVADADGWQDLLSGESLSNWDMLGDANWHFEDSAVAADSSTDVSYLVSKSDYADIELELEFWVDSEANSGVFLRCSSRDEVSDTICYEVNIFDTRPDQTYRTGAIVNVAEPAEFIYTGGQWNRYRILAEGPHLVVELNGRAMVDVEDTLHASGPIALQYGTGTVKFRNVRLRVL